METTQVAAATAEVAHAAPLQMPKLGSPAKDGKYAGVLTDDDGHVYVLVLLDAQPPKQLTWKAAQTWAEDVGGALPTRVESAQLFRALGAEFKKDWHWTSETYGSSGAWIQGFGYDNQDAGHVDGSYCARAVRRFVL